MKMRNMLVGGAVAVLMCAGSAQALTYNWTKLAAGTYNWDDAGAQDNWTEVGFPNAMDDIANLNKAFTGAQVINLNQTITVGTLNLGSSAGTGYKTTIASGTAGSLVMDVFTGNVLISKTSTLNRQEDVITASILLNDNLTLNSNQTDARGWVTISGIISGTGRTVEKTGAGLIRLVGAQLYDGGTTITTGALQLGSGVAGGNGSVVGNIVNNGMLAFNNADAQTLASSAYSGTGGLAKKGAGTLNLTGASWTVGGSFIADASNIVIDNGSTWSVGSGSSHVFYVGVGWSGLNALAENHTATLDMSKAASFTANVGKFFVGVTDSGAGGGTGVGMLTLGNSNITATNVVIGGSVPDQNGSSSNGGKVEIASGATVTIVTPAMSIGTSKAIAAGYNPSYLKLLGTGATLNLGNSSNRTALTIGSNTSGDMQNKTWAGDMNLSAGTGNLYLSGLVLAKNGFGGANANITGTMELGSASNVLNISGATNPVKIGYSNLSSAYTTTGTLTIDNLGPGSSVTATDDSTAIVVASRGGTSPVTGTLHLKGGTLTLTTGGAAIAGGGGTSNLYLGETGNVTLKAGAASTDWIHSLTTAEIKSGGATIDTAGYDIGISQVFSGAGVLTKTGLGRLTISGANTYGGGTLVQQGELMIAYDGFLTNGSVTGDVTVNPDAVIGGQGAISGALHLDAGAQIRFSPFGALNVTGNVSFGGLSVEDILDFDSLTADLNFPYPIIAGGIVSLANVAHTSVETAYDFGNGRKGYFEAGSLNLIVIPEPATFGIVLSTLAVAVIRRRRFG